MHPLTIIDDILRWVRGQSKIIVIPEQEDPLKWFERYRQKRIWQKREWWNGIWIGAILVGVVATVLKIVGIL